MMVVINVLLVLIVLANPMLCWWLSALLLVMVLDNPMLVDGAGQYKAGVDGFGQNNADDNGSG